MPVILIDSNVYLDFYFSRGQKYRGLLKNLRGVEGHVFVTKQIVDEVNRNKLKVFARDFGKPEGTGQLDFALPPSFEENSDARAWKAKHEAAKAKAEEVEEEFRSQVNAMAEAIGNSTDSVSRALAPLFNRAVAASAEVMTRARQRREIGNPPGKPDDPLGDQVTWELFLDAVKAGDAIWIVTNDTDYLVDLNRKVQLLNPLLYGELMAKLGAGGRIHCFNNLLAALENFSQEAKVKIGDLPGPEDRTAINFEIAEAAVSAATASESGWGTARWGTGKWGTSGFVVDPNNLADMYPPRASYVATFQRKCAHCGHLTSVKPAMLAKEASPTACAKCGKPF